MAALHWLVSQSLFLVSIHHYDSTGRYIPYSIDADGYSGTTLTLGWNEAPIVFSLAVGVALVMFLIITGMRRYPSGIPVAGSSSLAISAACQRQSTEKADIVLFPLMYGESPTKEGGDGSREPFAGFSAREVTPLQAGDHWPPP